jgi:light-regulated signal transduction histidine kinase (bacteriophytochrome)
LGFGKVVRDLTQRRRDDEELARYNAELETFSYTVSHDLRAPLRAIDGFAEILVQDHAGSLVPEARRQLLVIRDKAKQMSLLIDGLLNLARLGRLAVTRAPVDMHALAVSVYAELRGTVPEGREPPDLRLHPLPQALGDATLLRQVLANLFTNAFKFTRGRPKARVEIGAEQDGNQVTYHVKDNGTGFDMKDADRLFRVFSRLESAGEVEGTGIGLALVQRIVQRHGGRVWADGRPGEGATFFFNLPRA